MKKPKITYHFSKIIILSILFVCGCHQKGKRRKGNNQFKYTIIVQGKDEINRYDQLIDSARYIPLETDSNSIFGQIYKMMILHDTIIILDKTNDLLLTFAMNGKFLKKIGQKGRCPWCFAAIDDIALDREHDLIRILDIRQRKILKYSLSGAYKGIDIIPGIFPVGFAYDDGYTIYTMHRSPSFTVNSLYYDILVAKNQRLVSKYFPFDKNIRSNLTYRRTFYYYDNTLNFIRYREGEVYAITKDRVVRRFNIDFGKNQLPQQYMQIGGRLQREYDKPYSYLYDRLVENNKYVYFSYIEKQKIKFGIYSKPEHTFYRFNPKDPALSLFLPIYSYHNAFVSAIEPQAFIIWRKKFKSAVLINLGKTLKDYDNPVLVFHYTK